MAILAAAAAMGPDLAISSSSGGHDPYEVNLKIMIAAIVVLFSVILFILGLHLYAKWFWKNSQFGGAAGRRRQESSSLRLHDDDDPMFSNPAFGLDRAFLEALPTFVFHDKQQDSDKAKIPDCCAVCISEFQDGEAGRLLPKCGHAFHTECIDMWLHCHTTCPLCRTPIISLPWEARAKAEPVALDLVFLDPSILEEAAAAAAAAAQATAAAEAASSPRPSEQNPSSSVASNSLKPQDAQCGQLVIHIPQLSDGSSSSSSTSSFSSAPKSPKSRWRNLRRMLSRDRDRDRKVVPSVQSSPTNDVEHPGSSLD